jgi:ornithine carbamoyltransferase
MKNLLSLKDLKREELLDIHDKAIEIKTNPERYSNALTGKTLLMIFEKPSLRTRVSFEVAMTQMGGHAIFYSIKDSPLGKKETTADTAKTASRYADIIMARLFKHEDIEELAENSSIPVINALTDFSHPCQVIADLMTIKEKKGSFDLKLAYVGDGNNNVTHSLLYGTSIVGMDIAIGCPAREEYKPQEKVLKEAREIAKKTGSKIDIFHDAIRAVRNADIVYTDSWMSYHIPPDEEAKRIKDLKPFQVNPKLMNYAKKDAIFMHCLPAKRGHEVVEVIDGKQSVVFDQAENRLHAQKALMLKLLNKI